MNKETSVVEYSEELTAQGTVEKFGAVNQKGGYLSVGIKIPITGNDSAGAKAMAGMIALNLGNVTEITLKFSHVKSRTDGEDKKQGKLALDSLAPGEGPAAEGD